MKILSSNFSKLYLGWFYALRILNQVNTVQSKILQLCVPQMKGFKVKWLHNYCVVVTALRRYVDEFEKKIKALFFKVQSCFQLATTVKMINKRHLSPIVYLCCKYFKRRQKLFWRLIMKTFFIEKTAIFSLWYFLKHEFAITLKIWILMSELFALKLFFLGALPLPFWNYVYTLV